MNYVLEAIPSFLPIRAYVRISRYIFTRKYFNKTKKKQRCGSERIRENRANNQNLIAGYVFSIRYNSYANILPIELLNNFANTICLTMANGPVNTLLCVEVIAIY